MQAPALQARSRPWSNVSLGCLWVAGTLPALAAVPPRQPAPPEREVQAPLAPALMLARSAPEHADPDGYLVSEKLDGVRAFWDGRVLRLRGGGAVAAPAWFLALLPTGVALDGELWMGRGQFERVSGVVRREQPQDAEWQSVRYRVFDLPGQPGTFEVRWQRLQTLMPVGGEAAVAAVPQHVLPGPVALQRLLKVVIDSGGEGLMLHRARALWRAGRSDDLLKLKPVEDAEAVVVGHVPGRGRFAGLTGALKVRDGEGREFLVGSGLSAAQRDDPPPLGSQITYRWRGLTAAGVPRFATLWRVRPAGL